ncbi:MAG: SpoIIE family protein phosphatase [Acidobacteriota bacterium]
MKAKLRIEERDQPASDFLLGGDDVAIGRGAGNTLHFRDPWLSRVHARIVFRGDSYWLEDAGSRNGTFINGARVDTRQALSHGDSIELGDVRLRFVEDSSTQLQVAESEISLSSKGTVIISSEELRFDRYKESVAARRAAGELGAAMTPEGLLPALNAVASALISHYPIEQLVEKVLTLVLDAVPAERGALLLRRRGRERHGPSVGKLEVRARRGYGDDEDVRVSRTVIEVAVEARQAILTTDAQSDARFDRAESIMLQGIRSVLCVPLVNNDREVIGLIYLDDRIASPIFSETALRLVGLTANLAAVKVENCYLLEDQIERRRMAEQLALGAQIQRGLLPAEPPTIDGYRVRGVNRSCYEIGGDYFDFVPMDDGRWAIVIADISGKGVGAALLMAVLQASLRTLVHTAPEPDELVQRLNHVLVENSPSNKFATLFYAVLDPVRHTVRYVSGGHNPSLLLSDDGTLLELESTGPIVGLVPRAQFESREVSLEPGTSLLLYTDGITELMDDSGEEFGVERLGDLLRVHRGELDALIDAVDTSLREFGGESFDDDCTLVAVHRSL